MPPTWLNFAKLQVVTRPRHCLESGGPSHVSRHCHELIQDVPEGHSVKGPAQNFWRGIYQVRESCAARLERIRDESLGVARKLSNGAPDLAPREPPRIVDSQFGDDLVETTVGVSVGSFGKYLDNAEPLPIAIPAILLNHLLKDFAHSLILHVNLYGVHVVAWRRRKCFDADARHKCAG